MALGAIDRIVTLHTTEHSARKIAHLMGVNRETVGKCLTPAEVQNQPPVRPAENLRHLDQPTAKPSRKQEAA